jgi:hypothetical protein
MLMDRLWRYRGMVTYLPWYGVDTWYGAEVVYYRGSEMPAMDRVEIRLNPSFGQISGGGSGVGGVTGPSGGYLERGYILQAIKLNYDAMDRGWGLWSVGPGADGLWGTRDDDVFSSVRFRYERGLGNVWDLMMVFFSGSGGDGVWGTGDDDTPFISQGIRFVDNRLVESRANLDPGADGVWGSGDDRPLISVWISYDSQGYPLGAYYGDPGLDRRWGTPDDIVIQIVRIFGVYDACE